MSLLCGGGSVPRDDNGSGTDSVYPLPDRKKKSYLLPAPLPVGYPHKKYPWIFFNRRLKKLLVFK